MKIVIIYDEKIAGKYAKKMVFAYISAVASFMDAWIEITFPTFPTFTNIVASFMDAWIEINRFNILITVDFVASFMDAWIGILSHNDREI